MSLDDFMAAETGMSRTPGTCMTMGSASTMADCMMETMGIALSLQRHHARGRCAAAAEFNP